MSNNLEQFDIRNAMNILQQFGINPADIGPDKLEKLNSIGLKIQKPEDVTPEIASQITDILGIKMNNVKQPPRKRVGPKIGRNDSCPCNSGLKYKRCCLLNKCHHNH